MSVVNTLFFYYCNLCTLRDVEKRFRCAVQMATAMLFIYIFIFNKHHSVSPLNTNFLEPNNKFILSSNNNYSNIGICWGLINAFLAALSELLTRPERKKNISRFTIGNLWIWQFDVPCSGPPWLIFDLLWALPGVSRRTASAGGAKPLATWGAAAIPEGAKPPWTSTADAWSSVYRRKHTVTHTAAANTATLSHSDLRRGKPMIILICTLARDASPQQVLGWTIDRTTLLSVTPLHDSFFFSRKCESLALPQQHFFLPFATSWLLAGLSQVRPVKPQLSSINPSINTNRNRNLLIRVEYWICCFITPTNVVLVFFVAGQRTYFSFPEYVWKTNFARCVEMIWRVVSFFRLFFYWDTWKICVFVLAIQFVAGWRTTVSGTKKEENSN